MEIKLNCRRYVASLIIESGNATIKEELCEGDESIDALEKFITIANQLSRFNLISDVQFVKNMYDNFLCESEQNQFKELIS